MDATRVDWSMGSQAARLADWDAALAVGRRVAGPGISVPASERARMREDFAELTPFAEERIIEFTSLDPSGFRSRAWVMSQERVDPREPRRAPTDARAAGGPDPREGLRHRRAPAQGARRPGGGAPRLRLADACWVSTTRSCPPDDEGLLYFVGPNVAEVEQRFLLPPRDFRLWIAVHEVTHRVQFGSAPWLRDHIRGQVDRYLGTVSLESNDLGKQIRRAIDEARAGADVRGMGGLFLLLNDEQREIVRHVQGVMSLLEGHASFVMNEVAKDHVSDLPRMRTALAERRRRAGGIERSFQRAIGFDKKIEQYDAGERFVREVVSRSGMEGLNRVWLGPEGLPTVEEIAEPVRLGRARRRELTCPAGLRPSPGSSNGSRRRRASTRCSRPATSSSSRAAGVPTRVCLLYSLWHLRRLFKIRLAVFHFDHKLRPDSAKDAAYVRTLAERPEAPVPSPDGGRRTTEGGVRGGVGVARRGCARPTDVRRVDGRRDRSRKATRSTIRRRRCCST